MHAFMHTWQLGRGGWGEEGGMFTFVNTCIYALLVLEGGGGEEGEGGGERGREPGGGGARGAGGRVVCLNVHIMKL